MRPAGFEPAIIPVSEGRVERIINSLRFQATPRARSLSSRGGPPLRRNRVVVRPRFLGRPPHCPARIRTGDPWSKARRDCRFPTGLCLNAEDGPGTPREMASPNGRIPKPTASRTRFSVFWRHCLLAVSLTAVGTRHVPMGSAMPCASLQSSRRRKAYLQISASIAKCSRDERAREDSNPDPRRSKRPMLSRLHHMPDAPERN